MNHAALHNDAPELVAGDPLAHRLDELRLLAASHRLQWSEPVDTVLDAALGGPLPAEVWTQLAWYGPIDAMLQDERVSDVILNGPDCACLVVRQGVWVDTGLVMHPSWLDFIQRQLLVRGGRVSPSAPDAWPDPMVAGTTDGRLRYALTRPPATLWGPSIAIRVLPRRWPTLDELIREDVITRDAAELLLEGLRTNVSVLVSGSAGAGKTTLTAALLQAIGQERRCIVIEEAAELPRLPNSVHVDVVRSGWTFAACVRFSLRQKPELIVIGEVRGPEAMAMLKAASTGHPGVGTIHAPDPQIALKNLERMGCEAHEGTPEIVRGYITSPAVSLLVAQIGRFGGRRRVGLIAEVELQSGRGHVGDYYPLNPLFVLGDDTGRLERKYHVVGAWGVGRL